MTRLAMIACAALTLGGCAASGLKTTHATLERAEVDAELLYQTIVQVNASAVATGKMTSATATAYDLQAWSALQTARAAYVAGSTIDLTVLNAQAAAAKAGLAQ